MKVRKSDAKSIFLIVFFILLAIAAMTLSVLDNVENGGDDGLSGPCFTLALGFACVALSLKRGREYRSRFPDGQFPSEIESERNLNWVCSGIFIATGLFGLLLWALH